MVVAGPLIYVPSGATTAVLLLLLLLLPVVCPVLAAMDLRRVALAYLDQLLVPMTPSCALSPLLSPHLAWPQRCGGDVHSTVRQGELWGHTAAYTTAMV